MNMMKIDEIADDATAAMKISALSRAEHHALRAQFVAVFRSLSAKNEQMDENLVRALEKYIANAEHEMVYYLFVDITAALCRSDNIALVLAFRDIAVDKLLAGFGVVKGEAGVGMVAVIPDYVNSPQKFT